MKFLLAAATIAASTLLYTVPIGEGPKAVQTAERTISREEADVNDAQSLTGRWAPVETPDHIDEEKIDDEISEHFDLFCDVIYAESGNQGEYGMRLVADVIINRMRLGETLGGVLTSPNQFSCIKDGHAAKFHGHTRAEVRKVAQKELKHVTDDSIYYFRTEKYTPYGRDAYKYKDMYFSRRKT